MKTFFKKYVSHKYYLRISFVSVLCLVCFMAFYWQYFLKITNNVPYLETKLFYTPYDLQQMIQAYGENGRRLYVKTALSLDIVVPLLATNFLISVYCNKRKNQNETLHRYVILIGCFGCIFDWLENLCMITLICMYPSFNVSFAVVARIFTCMKYLCLAIVIYAIFQHNVKNIKN